jgi:hypothetical protein
MDVAESARIRVSIQLAKDGRRYPDLRELSLEKGKLSDEGKIRNRGRITDRAHSRGLALVLPRHNAGADRVR